MKDHIDRVGTSLPIVVDHPASPAPRPVMDNLWAKRQAENKRRNNNARRSRIGFPPVDAA